MPLLASQIDDFKTQVEEAEWTPEMANLMEALHEKKQQAMNQAKCGMHECLDHQFGMEDHEISDFIRTCLKDNRYPGYQLLKVLTTLLEKTPS